MEAFFRTHRYLVEHVNAPVRRTLMDEIDWSDRMIGIKGTRGIGKTTFLLQYAKEKFDINDRQCLYINMNNFYFREFINLLTGNTFQPYALEDIINHHEQIARQILPKVSPNRYFQDYIHHGFYPFFQEHRNYSENLLKTMNMMTEVDILLIKQIELKYLTKIKKLFYQIAEEGPAKTPNVSKLAQDIETSRATVMNYIKYLTDARLLNLIYPIGQDFPKKPAKIMLHNSNLMYAIYPIQVDKQEAMETFFVNSMWKDHKINTGLRDCNFIVDEKLKFRIVDAKAPGKMRISPDVIYARYNTEIGKANQIPLWLLGFLY